jgi:outer membrane protein
VDSVDDDTQLGIQAVYMFTNYFGLELLAATPFTHEINVDGLEPLGIDRVGNTKQLPPTLSAVFYPMGFSNPKSRFQPFVGLGLNYTIFWDEDASGQLSRGLAPLTGVDEDYKMDLDNSWGIAARAGIDFMVTDNFLINAGVWYIDIETEATFTGKKSGTKVKAKNVDIDPWVYTITAGWRF